MEESHRLLDRLIQHGYKPDDSWITRELNDDETTESVLCGHSERLAIVFNLLQRPIPSRIQIVKNLRVCGDCRKLKNYSNTPCSVFERNSICFRFSYKNDCSNTSVSDHSS